MEQKAVITGSRDLNVIQSEVDAWLYEQTGGVVQSGPFDGMKMLRDTSWKEAALSPMLLGCYEGELHSALEQEIDRLKHFEGSPNIVVVGCGEGYYAIGLKRRLPNATVYALDTNDKSLAICKRAAALNDVEIVIGAPLSTVFADPHFVFMDCEGAEVEYLNLTKLPMLTNAHMIVEIHNFPGQKTDDILLKRLRVSHRIDMIIEGPRNPSMSKYLCNLSNDYRWGAVNERRPCLMSWFYMRPRGMIVC